MNKNIDPCEDCRRNCEIPCWKVEHGLLRPVEWISVEERLPECDEKCLCCYVFKNEKMKFFRVLDYYATDKTPHFQHELGVHGMRVTHWMPLPQPPQDREGAHN